MKRYSIVQQTPRWDGKRVYLTTTYPVINPSDQDIVITASEADYLDTLAYKYYGDPTLWFILALANNLGNGRMSIEPGTQVRIPQNLSAILNEFAILNQA